MKSKWFKQFICIFLVVVFIVQLIPVYALPLESNEGAEEIVEAEDIVGIEKTEIYDPQVIGEVEELRDETVKHFRMSDGSYVAVEYSKPVHYVDDSGKWKDIDNSLALNPNEGKAIYVSNNGEVSKYFAKELFNGNTYGIKYKDYNVEVAFIQPDGKEISNSVENIGGVEATIIRNSEKTFEYNDIKSVCSIPDNFSSEVMYSNVIPNVDLKYVSTGYDIKESIVINAAQQKYEFSFELSLDNLTAVLENGEIILCNQSKETVFAIPAPYMSDASGDISYNVEYKLEGDTGKYLLTVVADSEWINDVERVFPVNIDPTIEIVGNGSANNISLATIIEGSPNTNVSASNENCIGYGSSASVKEERGLMGFDSLPAIPSNSEIVSANIGLYQYGGYPGNASTLTFNVYQITTSKPSNYSTYRSWITSRKWSTQPSHSNEIVDYCNTSASKYGYLFWDITRLAKGWYADASIPRALTIALDNVSQYNSGNCALARVFTHANTNNSSLQPVLIVSYRHNLGLENYYSYQPISIGNAGTAFIEDHTGQMTVVTPIASFESASNPFSLTLIYNSGYFKKSFGVYDVPSSYFGLATKAGSGMTFNFIQKVSSVTIGEEQYLEYTDGDGTRHFFSKDSTRSASYYYDEDGLGYKIIGSNGQYTMSDDIGNTWAFENGLLTQTRNSNNIGYNITYENNRIKTIVQKNTNESDIVVATFNYDNTGTNYISSVEDYAGVIYSFEYTNSRLTAIKRDNQAFVSFTYCNGNTESRISEIKDEEADYAIHFDHAQHNGYMRVSGYHELSSLDTAGNEVKISYNGDKSIIYKSSGVDAIIDTSDDVITELYFDDYGRTVNAVSWMSREGIIGASNSVYSGYGNTDKTNNRTIQAASIGINAQNHFKNGGFESGAASNEWTFYGAGQQGQSNCVIKDIVPNNDVKVRTGTKAFKAWLSGNSSNTIGISKSIFLKSIPEYNNNDFTASVYVDTSSANSFIDSGGIYLEITAPNGTKYKSEKLNYSTSLDIDNGWSRISVSFPCTRTGYYSIALKGSGYNGYLYADDFQVEKGSSPSNVNLLDDSAVQSDTTTLLTVLNILIWGIG